VLAAATICLGFALIAVTIAHGGGEVGIMLGLLFVAAGTGRLYLTRNR